MNRVSALSTLVVSALGVSSFLLSPPAARAYQPVVTKLHGRATAPQVDNQFGTSVAATENWLLVGEVHNNDVADNAGAAHLYDARTGRYLRKLTAPDGAAGDGFGISVALSGNLALVGAWFGDGLVANSGTAYVFNVLTGALVRKLTAPDGAKDDTFGRSVALSGTVALVGANQDDNEKGLVAGSAYAFNALTGTLVRKLIAPDGTEFDKFGVSVALSGNRALVGASEADGGGSAYVMDAVTGDLLTQLMASDRADGDFFGFSVALSGNRALVGACFDDDLGEGSGSAYVFDARSGVQLRKLTAPDGANFDRFGVSVALSGNRALIGARGDDGGRGSAYVLDAVTGDLVAKLTAADGAAGDTFGVSVALSGNRALVGAIGNDDLDAIAGAAYYYREVAVPLPLRSLSQTRNFAPGLVDAEFRAFGEAVINEDGEVAFPATLMGPGAGRGVAAAGLWSDGAGMVRLIARGGTDLGVGLLMGAVGRPVFNRAEDMIFTGTLAGANVSAATDATILRSTAGGLPVPLVREGDARPFTDGAVFAAFPAVAHSHTGDNADIGVAFRYRIGVGGVGRGSDSGVMTLNHDGSDQSAFDENHQQMNSVPGAFFGEFTPRVSKTGAHLVWSAALLPSAGLVTTADNFGVFKARAGLTWDVVVARKGTAAPGTAAIPFAAFTGEAGTVDGAVVYRAALGLGATRANNAGLWRDDTLVVRKGDQPDPLNEPGVAYAMFPQFWPAGPGRVMFRAVLAGPRVHRGNDVALYLWDNGVTQRLLREGDPAQTEDGAVIAVINRVDVEPVNGHYAVLATLSGNRAANLALYTGGAGFGNNGGQQLNRVPGLVLRKGTAFQGPAGETTRLLALLIGNTTDAMGVGAKGGPQIIESDGNLVMTVLLSNGSVELMKGIP